jgi:hypothetical protein
VRLSFWLLFSKLTECAWKSHLSFFSKDLPEEAPGYSGRKAKSFVDKEDASREVAGEGWPAGFPLPPGRNANSEEYLENGSMTGL